MFKRIAQTAGFTGLLAALLLTLLQSLWVVPLIQQAETYENASAEQVHEHAGGTAAAHSHVHEEAAWEPEDGWQRVLSTTGGNLVVAVGFALMLAGLYTLATGGVGAASDAPLRSGLSDDGLSWCCRRFGTGTGRAIGRWHGATGDRTAKKRAGDICLGNLHGYRRIIAALAHSFPENSLTVYFIGAGPGDPELITVKGQRLIRSCPVIIYAGSLVPLAVLEGNQAIQVTNSAELHLEQIIDLIKAADAQGQDVARVHSGDPSLYGAIGEQIRHLRELNIPYEIIPGVTATAACAALLGVELTLPDVSQSVILTRYADKTSMPSGEELDESGQP